MDKINHYKQEAQKQWTKTPCGSSSEILLEKESLEFFDSVRKSRYDITDQWMKEKIPFSSGKGKKLLEIGYGLGSDLLSWCENGADVYGIDITPEHYRLSKINLALHGRNADIKLADACDIPFSSNYFDLVYSNGVLHHTPDTVRCISEAYRVLKPGGQFICSLYYFYSAFHLFQKVLYEGIGKGKLFNLGYAGLMATVEYGADGKNIKPLVKLYTKRQLKIILSDFTDVRFKIAHFKRSHIPVIGHFIPSFFENLLEPWWGWYLIAYATK